MKTWKITGTRRGNLVTVTVQAADRNAAVRAASHAPHMLVVYSVVLID